MSLSLRSISFKVGLAACYFNPDLYIKYKLMHIQTPFHYDQTFLTRSPLHRFELWTLFETKTSTPLFLIGCGAYPPATLSMLLLLSERSSESRVSMLPADQTALRVVIPVQTTRRVNKVRIHEDVQDSHLVNCQLIKLIQFLDNKRSTLFFRWLKS